MMNKRINKKGALPTTTIIIIAIVGMVIATAILFLLLPYFEEEYGKPGECDDTCYYTEGNEYITVHKDCAHPSRQINYYPNGPSDDMADKRWQYLDNFEGYNSGYHSTLLKMGNTVYQAYIDGKISELSWHWFTCTVKAIS